MNLQELTINTINVKANNNFDELLSKLSLFNDIKSKHGDMLLIFQLGNKCYSIEDDAIKLNTCLKKDIIEYKDMKFCGFDYNMLDEYLPKLIKCWNKVGVEYES